MSQYERTQVLNSDSSIVDREFSSSALEDEVIKEGLSYFSERPQNIFKLTTIPATTVAPGSKRKKPSRVSQSQVGVQHGIESISLSEFDFEEEPEVSNQNRSQENKLLFYGKTLLSLVKKDKLILPTQVEIDSGYLFDKEFSFQVNITNVRPASNIFTNQRILNIANAEVVYKRLKEAQFNESHVMTLRPMEYFQLDNGEKYVFKSGESQTDFLRCLNTIKGGSLEEKREKFASLVIWEPVDGQHILHACQVLVEKDLALDQLSQQQFDKLFVKRPAVVVAYNEEWKYLIVSFKKNDENTEMKYHSTIEETLEKARAVWEEFGSPNPYNEDDVERRRLFFQCLP
jgi:hypothetical protein